MTSRGIPCKLEARNNLLKDPNIRIPEFNHQLAPKEKPLRSKNPSNVAGHGLLQLFLLPFKFTCPGGPLMKEQSPEPRKLESATEAIPEAILKQILADPFYPKP